VVIFRGMYDLIGKTRKKPFGEVAIVHKDPVPILSADQLLATEKRQQALGDMRSLLNLPEEEFKQWFQTVADNFAEFVQNLPETEKSYYSGIGGILDHALERAALSLSLCRTYLLPEDATLASVDENEMIWVYAVYTAALLYDIGKIATSHVITLTDESGKTIKSWLPYAGPMTHEEASHYIFGFSEDNIEHMRWIITPLLARQILPAEGFNWIANDSAVLESWLALLSDDHRQVGSLLTVIRLADAQLIESVITNRKIAVHPEVKKMLALLNQTQKEKRDKKEKANQKDLREKMLSEKETDLFSKDQEKTDVKKAGKHSLFAAAAISATQDKERKTSTSTNSNEIAGKFLDWVKEKLDKKSLSHNQSDSLIHHVKEGVVIDQRVLQQFIQDSKLSNINVEQLKQLITRLPDINPTNYADAAALAAKTGQYNPALLVTNPYMVFPAVLGVPPMASGGMVVVFPPSNPVQAQQHIEAARNAVQQNTAPLPSPSRPSPMKGG
jgi:integrating conjugative element relaxase (TIGR03760 family)